MERRITPINTCLPLAILALLIGAETGNAQLLSPGKLSTEHSHLEGIRACTNCHVLGERGVSNRLCLDCHEPIRNRLAQQSGYHATVAERSCAECHKDHFGEDFQLVRFDTASFEHSTVGFNLVEAHGALECEDCHQPELITAADVRSFKGEHGALAETLLGLGTTCPECHAGDDPHGRQFADRACLDCHNQTSWDIEDIFDHDRTRYRLTGLHRREPCASCHPATKTVNGTTQVKYTNIRFSACTSCHEDEHEGAMGENCTRCHNTSGWNRLDRVALESQFDHQTTGYSLVAAHAELSCSDCHDPGRAQRSAISLSYAPEHLGNAYPAPDAASCTSCHLDFHEAVFEESAGGSECENCHSQREWIPGSYDIARHNIDARFELTGAHVVTPCRSCHGVANSEEAPLRFRIERDDCVFCHEADDPHNLQFAADPCSECHTTDAFAIEFFDHSKTAYPLDGEHRNVDCNDCHLLEADASGRAYRVYKPLGMECRDCHGGI